MYFEDGTYYDPKDFEINNPDENEYDYLKEIEEIESKYEDINNINKYNINFESYNEDNVEYLSYIELIKKELENKTFREVPYYHKKSFLIKSAEIDAIKSITDFIIISPLELYYTMKYETHHKISHDEDKCIICMDNLYEISKKSELYEVIQLNEEMIKSYNVILLDKCKDHFFHIDCISEMVGKDDFIKCPICGIIYGIQKGTQPYGTMTAYLTKEYICEGYENDKTIVIKYKFPNGSNYTGTSRTAYLPDNKQGRKILGLLKVCFDRKLIFTVGTSVTTGESNTTVWSGIHHKTNISGGAAYFGYPDPTYFNRVREEMASRGVTEESLHQKPEKIANQFLESFYNKK